MKSMSIIFIYIVLSNLFISKTWAQDITGMWKVIDDKSGYARAKVNIYKSNDGSYEGKIEEVYPLPGQSAPFSNKCFRCKGELKDTPVIGMRILYGLKRNIDKPEEYSGGNVIDPISGNIYKGKIKTNASVTRINLRGYIGTSALGRTQVWMRMD
ncbi:DUF2147 domain-containing protein [Acinetobacter corruptisaponis]|uniref:DUF2147 domain-containing protein n=1 Tax=Acinetobacter corruptisaponis TaxID=3045147 RepID=A0ABY8S4C9_9GAMM|nr:DUF2147 domain-containing protein [Acinetobacter sp. KCTC 92772]WHP05943.1 DUF2147 domain-containing protein [Acinetobacter sp. KCTC 92772]